MALQAASFPLSLRPVHRKRDAETLSQVIGRINEERGHFRNITEDNLQAEVEAKTSHVAGEEVTEDEVIIVEDLGTRRKEIYAARADLIKLVG